MKKIIAILLCVVMVVTAFCSCGKGGNGDNTTTTQPQVDENAVKEIPAEMVAEPMKAATEFAGGTGTEEDPYLISDAAQLVLMAETIKEKNGEKLYFKLTNDIAFNDTTDFANWEKDAPQYLWTPVDNFYRGGLDGDGYTISGLYGYEIGGYLGKEGDSEYDLGFFNTIGADAYVKNLKISNSYFNGLNQVSVGCIAGHFYGTLTNCQVLDSVVKTRISSAGALAGSVSDATVENCETNDGVVVSGKIAGAIFGYVGGGTYKNCVARGTVNGEDNIGGFSGMAHGKFEDITNYATVEAIGTDTVTECGGCFGHLSAGSDGRDEGEERITTVKNCVNYSENLKGTYSTGGIIGNVNADNTDRKTNIINCQNKANITSDGLVGGIAAETLTRLTGVVTYSGCTNDGVITSNDDMAGGIVAKNVIQEGSLVVEKCVNNGAISSLVDVGGILADISYLTLEEKNSNHFTISNCTNNGDVTGKGDFAGGIVGKIGMTTSDVDMVKIVMTEGDTGLIENCKNTGKITASAGDKKTAFAGGIAGLWNTPITKCEVKNCSNSGEIATVDDGSVNDNPEIVYESGVSGIIGLSNDNVKLEKCKNSGKLTAIKGCLKGDLVASKGDFFQSKKVEE